MDLVLYDKNGNLLKTTQSGRLGVYKKLPDMVQLVAEGKVWAVQDQTTTAEALVAPPTTTAGLTMQNPAGSDKYYVILGHSYIVDVMAVTAEEVSIWICTHKLAAVAFTRDLTLVATGAGAISCLKAGKAYDGQVILDRGATVVDDGWVPLVGDPYHYTASNVDLAHARKLLFPVVIPPGFHASVASVLTENTIEVGHGLIWAELDPEDVLEQ